MVILILLWCGWCLLHSLLITTSVQQWVAHKGGVWQGGYRLFYVGVSCGTLVPVLWYMATWPQEPLGPFPWWVQLLQLVLLLYAVVLFIAGARSYNMKDFLGLRQWQEYRQGRVVAPLSLYTGGILRYLRHPWYSGGIALLCGLPGVTDVTLVTRLVLIGYFILGALLEERKMRLQFGDAYRDYCRRTPMLIPWKL
nr:hypothetical protein [uncultured Desulfobulbus sp.]